MTGAWRVHWCVLQTSISERLTYRGDFVLGTLVRFLPIVTQVFLWTAVYGASERQSIQGYRYRDMVAYSLLVMLARAFSSMPGLAGGIARDIREGTIKKYTGRPHTYRAPDAHVMSPASTAARKDRGGSAEASTAIPARPSMNHKPIPL